MTFNKKSLFIWLSIVAGVGIIIYSSLSSVEAIEAKKVNISGFVKMINSGEVESVKMTPEYILAKTNSGEQITVSYPVYYSPALLEDMMKKDISVDFLSGNEDQSGMSRFFGILGGILSWLPIIFIGWIMYNALKGSGGGKGQGGGIFGGGGPFSFGKNKAKVLTGKELKVKLDDVAGVDEAKQDLSEIVDFLKDPLKYHQIGGVIPKGCLLIGPPGTGKTMLAKAMASEAGVPFFFISGSDFVEMFVGVGASRVRDMFLQAKKSAPCIIFIDEIDAVGRHRGVGIGGGNDEREQTLNQLLVEMDGFEANNGVVVIAATNRADVLDNALLRPGRFDRQIFVNLPDIAGRERILESHMKKIKVAPSVNIRTVAKGTPGFSGAELANLVNEAALLAARDNKKIVTAHEFEEARDKLLMGVARKTIMKDEEKKLTAYHEGAHALVAIKMMPAGGDPIHKATIVPRGRSLGLVMRLPEGDRFSSTREKMLADMRVGAAGRLGEELIFGYDKVTSGASSDIQMVTKMARAMVVEWGLSDKVGFINYSDGGKDAYTGQSKHSHSERSMEMIDDEVRRIVDKCYTETKKILEDNMDDLHKIAAALLEFETLTGDEIESILKGEKIRQHSETYASGNSSIGGALHPKENITGSESAGLDAPKKKRAPRKPKAETESESVDLLTLASEELISEEKAADLNDVSEKTVANKDSEDEGKSDETANTESNKESDKE